MTDRIRPIVVMGVSGSGKSTVGEALAAARGLPFVDADALHPQANLEKMAAGIPLTDDDRSPWLAAVADAIAPGAVVVACSALRRSYRDVLRTAAPDLALVYLHASQELLDARMRSRHHFMPVSLLASQLATLESPTADEKPIQLDASAPIAAAIARVTVAL